METPKVIARALDSEGIKPWVKAVIRTLINAKEPLDILNDIAVLSVLAKVYVQKWLTYRKFVQIQNRKQVLRRRMQGRSRYPDGRGYRKRHT